MPAECLERQMLLIGGEKEVRDMGNTMKKALFTALFIALGCSVAAYGAASGDGKIFKFSIGAASPGGGFYMGASAVSTVVNSKLKGYEANVEVTGASANNAMLVQAGEIEMGMCATEVAWEAYNGKFDFEGKYKCDKIRTVMPGWGGVYMFITTADSGIKDIYGFEGKGYSGGPVGSSNEIISKRLFSLFGIKPKMMNLPTSDASRSLGDGTISGFTLAHPSAAVSELEATQALKLLAIPKEGQQKFKEAYPQYIWLEIPKGYYKALPEGGYNAGLYNLVISSSDQDEEFIYQVVKACYENRELIKTVFPQFSREMDLKFVESATIPYHRGAVKYFKEQGITLPEKLLPPEMK